MQTISQTEQIRKHLESGGTITPLDALDRYGCLRLGARIHDLKNDGLTIYSRMVTRCGKRFSEYSAKPFTATALLAVNWNQQIGESRLVEIVVALAIVVLFITYSLIYHARKANEAAQRAQYPPLCKVAQASEQQIRDWLYGLPPARTQREFDIIGLIITRYLSLIEEEKQ